MDSLLRRMVASPLLVRVAPFAVFVALTFCQGKFGETSRYWIYAAKTVAGAWLIWLVRPFISEMRWTFSWESVVVGVAVFAMWVGIDGLYPSFDRLSSYVGLARTRSEAELASESWNPHAAFGRGSGLAWMFIAVRVLGSSLVVPPLEEVFYRSFFYRYIARLDFQSVPLGEFHRASYLITAVVFGFAHQEWLAAILCGFAYQGLVCRMNRLGDAIAAHAITNFLLGLWVIWRGAWKFW